MSHLPVHTEAYTIRCVDSGPHMVPLDAFHAIREALGFGMKRLELPGHLFVTVVGADSFVDPIGESLGIYHEGIQHVAIAASPDRELQELQLTAFHELLHYQQDLDGVLGTISEMETEEQAGELLDVLFAERVTA